MTKTMKKWGLLFLSLILILALAACAGGKTKPESLTSAEVPSEVISLFEGVRTRVNDVTYSGVRPYSGAFTEDGGDRQVENVACASFYNGGDRSIRYMVIDAKTADGKDLTFKLTTVPPMKTISVPELNASPYEDGMEIVSISCSQSLYFETEPSAMTGTFEYSVAKGAITVKNISGADIDAEVAVYYKNVDGEDLLGGTTFRTTIPGGLRDGASATATAGHFDPENTAILFAEVLESEPATDG